MNLVERFGTNVALDVTTPTSPKLVITLKDLTDTPNGDIINGVGLDDVSLITQSTKDEYADKIFAALFILSMQKQPTTDTDSANGCWITPTATRSFVTRNNVQQVRYAYTTSFYKADILVTLNPDLIV